MKLPLKVSIRPPGFLLFFWASHFLTPKSSFKVRALATPNKVDRETAPERDLVPESTVTTFQEPRTKFNSFGGSFLHRSFGGLFGNYA